MNRKQSTSIMEANTPKSSSKITRTLSHNSSSSFTLGKIPKIIKTKPMGKQNLNENQLVLKNNRGKENQNGNTNSMANMSRGLKKVKDKAVQGCVKFEKNQQDMKTKVKYKLPVKKIENNDKKHNSSQSHSNKSVLSEKNKKTISRNKSASIDKKITHSNSVKSTPKNTLKKIVTPKTNPKQPQTQISFYTINQLEAKQEIPTQFPLLPSITTYITPSFPQSQLLHAQLKAQKKGLMISMFHIRYKLAQNSFSTTFEVVHIETGFLFCLKVFEKQKIKQQGLQEQIITEIKFRQNCAKNQRNLQKLFTYFDDEVYLYFIEQYLLGFGTIEKELQTKRRFSQKQSGLIFKEVLQSVRYIQSQNYIHRDIRLQNFVRCLGMVKIIDFSWIAFLKYKKQRDTFCGTYKYAPPELLEGQSYDQSIDIWSLGILLYQLCTGHSPFQQEIGKRNSQTMNFPIFLSNELVDLIGRLLSEKGIRIKMQEIDMHEWTNKWQVDGFVCKEIWDFWVL